MKALGLLLSGLFCVTVHAATSDILMSRGGGTFAGAAGNVVFDGQQFVTPVVQSNGAIRLVFLDTNGVAFSNLSLSITGSSPRLALDGASYLLAWLDANATLLCARLTNGSAGTASAVATNVLAETLSLRAANGNFLAVWQSTLSNSAVIACGLAPNGSALAAPFAVSSSASPQRYPSLNNEGANYLACWMEQNTESNDWRVVAGFIDASGPLSAPFDVSQTNSLLPHPTACSFGTNYLVAWSSDEIGGYYYLNYPDTTNHWLPTIQGRTVSPAGIPISNAFTIAKNIYWNTNPAVAFGDGNFLVAWATVESYWVYAPPAGNQYQGQQRVQRLSSDGSRHGYPVRSLYAVGSPNQPRIGFGQGRFCVLYPHVLDSGPEERTYSIVFGPDQMAKPVLTVRRTTDGGTAVDNSSSTAVLEVSTNLVNWTPSYLTQLTALSGLSRLFVRSYDRKWDCIEQLRAIDWAKQRWAFETKKANSDILGDNDLFGPTHYLTDKPRCPHNGTYILGTVEAKPACTVAGHTL